MDFQLVVLRGRSSSKGVKLAEGITTVGRQDDCQLRIASSQVSRKHCQLFEHKGHLLVKDLGSANGTYVNGQKIATQRVLEAGDELAIGPVKFRVEKQPGPGPGSQARPARPAATASDTAVGPAGVDSADDAPILGTPVADDEPADATSQEFDVELDETPIALGEDDAFEIDFDEALPGTEPSPAAARAAAPTPAPAEAHAKSAGPPAHEPKEELEGEVGDDAVADFLMNLKIDDD